MPQIIIFFWLEFPGNAFVAVPHTIASATRSQNQFGESARFLSNPVKQFVLSEIGVLAAPSVVLYQHGEQVRVLVRIERVEYGESVATDVQQCETLGARRVAMT